MTVEERLARLETVLGELRTDIQSIDRSINGPPPEGTVRKRIHDLESSQAAAALMADWIKQQEARKSKAAHTYVNRVALILSLPSTALAIIVTLQILGVVGGS